jgi:hypothetical protein
MNKILKWLFGEFRRIRLAEKICVKHNLPMYGEDGRKLAVILSRIDSNKYNIYTGKREPNYPKWAIYMYPSFNKFDMCTPIRTFHLSRRYEK